MDYCRVLAIDMGTRNFAWCVVDNNNWKSPIAWYCEDLITRSGLNGKKPTRHDYVTMAYRWVERNRQLIDTCDVVALERQMRTPFIIMNATITALCYGRVQELHPVTVGNFWQLPRDRLRKKPAGVSVCQRNTERDFPPGVKVDDLADAWMMAVYAMVKREALSKTTLLLH